MEIDDISQVGQNGPAGIELDASLRPVAISSPDKALIALNAENMREVCAASNTTTDL
jgi:hypothetical protein